jgi:hypothetical protein
MSRETESTNSFNEYLEQKKLIWERRKLGIELRNKFNLYFTTLTFTLLGLAIQTSNKSSSPYINYAEIISWVFLFLSGLIGLYALSILWLREVGVAEISYSNLSGISNERMNKELEDIEKKIRGSEKIKWIFFLIGISTLMLSRGFQLFQ